MVTSLIKFLIDPFNILLVLIIFSVLAWSLRKKLIFHWLISVSAGWFFISSTPFLPVILVNSLEDRYEPVNVAGLDDLYSDYHIIVLGSGHGFDDRLPANSLLSLNALGRLSEGIRLYQQLPNSTLILSGYSSSGRTTQAEMLQKAAILMGVDEERTMIQTEPSNTFEEAQTYSSKFEGNHPLIVITSAAHMPRAIKVFEHFDTSPIASPTDYRLKGSWKNKRLGFPSLSNMVLMRTAIFEYAALTRDEFKL